MTENRIWKPRILANISTSSAKLGALKSSTKLLIDDRAMTAVGNEFSADILTEYDTLVLDFANEIHEIPERIDQLNNFVDQKKGILIYALRRFTGEWNRGNNYAPIFSFLNNRLGDPRQLFHIKHNGSDFTPTMQGKTTVFSEYLISAPRKW